MPIAKDVLVLSRWRKVAQIISATFQQFKWFGSDCESGEHNKNTCIEIVACYKMEESWRLPSVIWCLTVATVFITDLPALRIFCTERTCPLAGESMLAQEWRMNWTHDGTRMNSPARTVCWHMTSTASLWPAWCAGQTTCVLAHLQPACCRWANVGMGQTSGQMDNRTDNVKT